MIRSISVLLTLLMSIQLQGQSDFGPSFSPDGKRIMFYRYIDKVPELLVINKDGTGLETITERTGLWSIGASWSEDGKRIYFSQGEGMQGMDFASMDLETKEVLRVKAEHMQFAIPREGKYRYWASKEPEGNRFYRSKSDDLKKPEDITIKDFKNQWVIPVDDKRLAVSVKDTHLEGIWVGQPDELKKILDHKQVQNMSTSKDKQWLLFESKVDDNSDIYRVRLDGSDLQRLTTDEGPDYMPSFSPDGKSVVFSSARSGAFCLYILDIETKNITQLTGVQ